MAHDPALWADFAAECRSIRGDVPVKNLGVETSGISRLESNERTPRLEQVEAYARYFDRPDLVERFNELLARTQGAEVAHRSSEKRLAPQSDLLDLDYIVDVSDTITIWERVVLVAPQGPRRAIPWRNGFESIDGVRVSPLSVTAYRAKVTKESWITERLHQLILQFPRELGPDSPPYDFTIKYELPTSMQPVIFHSNQGELRHLKTTVKLPSAEYDVFAFDGAMETATADRKARLLKGGPDSSSYPLNTNNEVTVDFYNLKPGGVYGLLWRVH